MAKKTISIDIDSDLYEKMNIFAKAHNTSVEEICERFIHLCIKEDGFVVFDNEDSYQVLKTRDDVKNYLDSKGYDCDNCYHSKYAGYAAVDGVSERCLYYDEDLENFRNKTIPCSKCMGVNFLPDNW